MKKMIIIAWACLSATWIMGQDLSLYERKEFTRNGQTLLYRILYPVNYDADKKYRLIVFLHGAGERGSDNQNQLSHGGSFFLTDSIRKNYPAIVIFPQCPKDSTWSTLNFTLDTVTQKRTVTFAMRESPCTPQLLVKELMDSLIAKKHADRNYIYIGGLSLGGFGTYEMIERYPAFFAVDFPRRRRSGSQSRIFAWLLPCIAEYGCRCKVYGIPWRWA